MQVVNIEDKRDKIYLIPLGDIHIGSKAIDLHKLMGYIEWIREHDAYVFLMGDLFDVATRVSKTSPFEQSCDLNTAMNTLSKIIRPIKNKIIGCISGNHEHRLKDYAGFDVLDAWCSSNDIKYFGYSAVIRFRVGTKRNLKRKKELPLNKEKIEIFESLGISPKHKEKEISTPVEYVFFAHHTVGGGRTIGGKLNKVAQLLSIFAGADCYLGGHNHSKALGEDAVAYLEGNKIKYRRIMYVDCGSFQLYNNGYAEKGALPPSHTGAPRIRLSGTEKDIHVSF